MFHVPCSMRTISYICKNTWSIDPVKSRLGIGDIEPCTINNRIHVGVLKYKSQQK